MKQSLDYIKEFYPKNWAKINNIQIDDVLEIIDNVINDLFPCGDNVPTFDNKMKLREAYEILSLHQAWRMGAEVKMIEPKIITEAINIILTSFKKRSKASQGNQNKRMDGIIDSDTKDWIFAAIASIYHIERHEIEQLRSVRYRKQLQFICGYFLGSNCSQDEIGKVINRKRSMVSKLTKEFVIREAKDVVFKMQYKEFKELLNEKISI